jgi:hypothetical protein
MSTHDNNINDYQKVPPPPSAGVQIAIFLCGLLIAIGLLYRGMTGHW